jgi:hypothetical protein
MPRRVTSSKRIPQKLVFMENHLPTWGQRWSAQKRARRSAAKSTRPRSEICESSYDIFPSQPEPPQAAGHWTPLDRSKDLATFVLYDGASNSFHSHLDIPTPHSISVSTYSPASSYHTEEEFTSGVINTTSRDESLFGSLLSDHTQNLHHNIYNPGETGFPSPTSSVLPYSCSAPPATNSFNSSGSELPFENIFHQVPPESNSWSAYTYFIPDSCPEIDYSFSDLTTTPSPSSSAADLDLISTWSPSHPLPHSSSGPQLILDSTYLSPGLHRQSPSQRYRDLGGSHTGGIETQDQLSLTNQCLVNHQLINLQSQRSKRQAIRKNSGPIGNSRSCEYPGASLSEFEF